MCAWVRAPDSWTGVHNRWRTGVQCITGPDCEYVQDAPAVPSFIYNFESFTVRIRHGVRGQQVNKEGVSTGDKQVKVYIIL